MGVVLETSRRLAGLAAVALGAACATPEPEVAGVAQPANAAAVAPAPGVPGTATRDLNGDGFIDAREAAGYYARRFGQLDRDGDARLSREELATEFEGLDDPEAAFGALDLDTDLMISQDEYFQSSSSAFRQQVNPASGMMSSSDFDTMIRYKEPLSEPPPEPGPEG